MQTGFYQKDSTESLLSQFAREESAAQVYATRFAGDYTWQSAADYEADKNLWHDAGRRADAIREVLSWRGVKV